MEPSLTPIETTRGNVETQHMNGKVNQTPPQPEKTPSSPIPLTHPSGDKHQDVETKDNNQVNTIDLQKERREKKPLFYCRWIATHPKRAFGEQKS